MTVEVAGELLDSENLGVLLRSENLLLQAFLTLLVILLKNRQIKDTNGGVLLFIDVSRNINLLKYLLVHIFIEVKREFISLLNFAT